MSKAILDAAKTAQQDEFYTQLSDIENELKHYKKHFEGKTILCNCDDPYESNFFKYFALNFNNLNLKKLICTCYNGSPISGDQLSIFDVDNLNAKHTKQAYKVELTEVVDYNKDGSIDLNDVEQILKRRKSVLTLLDGNGDFRSQECIKLLKESDIVVTNPPFSLWREYLDQLIKYGKQFLIIGNMNAITYKEVFPLLANNKVWLGYKNGDMSFRVPDHFQPRETRYWQDETGQKWRSLGNICWFTNLDIKKRHDNLPLTATYKNNELLYPKFDNFDAININKVSDIPSDYYGCMAVPITFMDKYNPDQFEIEDAINRYALLDSQKTNDDVHKRKSHMCNINGVATYFRIIIRRK